YILATTLLIFGILLANNLVIITDSSPVPKIMSRSVHQRDIFLSNTPLHRLQSLQRGDAVRFITDQGLQDLGFDASLSHIRIIVGLPEETIEIREQQVLINGEPLQALSPDLAIGVPANLDLAPTVIPANTYFVMGQNPDYQEPDFAAFVPRQQIQGQVVWRLFPPQRFGPIGK
ncbi:MAG: signal peptidase I, partial [Cyanobacteria bacterium P01_H01_bin.121]